MRGLLLPVLLSVSAFASLEATKQRYKQIDGVSSGRPTAVVFDFHGVIAPLSKKKAINGFAKHGKKGRFIKKLFKRESGKSYESVFLNKEGKLSADDLRALNPHSIDAELIQIAKDVKAKGYPIFVCTDAGEHSIDAFKKERPDLFGKDGLFNDVWCSAKGNGNASKKTTKAFELTKKMVLDWATTNGKPAIVNFVMIDDSEEKLDAAYKVGFDGYQFKSAKELRKALERAGIL